MFPCTGHFTRRVVLSARVYTPIGWPAFPYAAHTRLARLREGRFRAPRRVALLFAVGSNGTIAVRHIFGPRQIRRPPRLEHGQELQLRGDRGRRDYF